VRHPLKTPWTLWYDDSLGGGKRPQGTWGEQIKEVLTVSTVEDFWRLYNNVAPPSQLPPGCSYNLFRRGVEPKWEDPANAKGGKWTILLQKKPGLIDKYWLWLILGCIGETIDEEDQICGAVVNIRKQDKLCLWTRDAENSKATLKIGSNIKKILELPENFPCGYSGHFQEGRSNKYSV